MCLPLLLQAAERTRAREERRKKKERIINFGELAKVFVVGFVLFGLSPDADAELFEDRSLATMDMPSVSLFVIICSRETLSCSMIGIFLIICLSWGRFTILA